MHVDGDLMMVHASVVKVGGVRYNVRSAGNPVQSIHVVSRMVWGPGVETLHGHCQGQLPMEFDSEHR